MNPSGLTIGVAALLIVTIAAYALFAGADFGGGIWDLLAGGDRRGAQAREEIDASVTPVWEGNHVWIIFGLVVFWTGFPSAFSAVMIALFVPLALSLLGIVLRGVGFAFRHEAERLATKRMYGVMFAASSLMTPFFLGTAVGAVATEAVPANPAGNILGAWTSPTALVTGLLFVATCAYIACIYLVSDTQRRGHPAMVGYFRRRAVAAGVVAGILAAISLVLLRESAPYLWQRLLGPALPAVVVSVVSGIAALVFLRGNRPNLLRVAAALAVVGVVAGWGVAQYPWILPGALTLEQSSAPVSAQLALFVVLGMALLFVLPGFAWLYWLQQHEVLHESPSPRPVTGPGGGSRDTAQDARPSAVQLEPNPHPLLASAVLALVAARAVRQLFSRRNHRG